MSEGSGDFLDLYAFQAEKQGQLEVANEVLKEENFRLN